MLWKSTECDSNLEQLLGAGGDPIQHSKRNYLLWQDTNSRGKALYWECQAHPLPPVFPQQALLLPAALNSCIAE